MSNNNTNVIPATRSVTLSLKCYPSEKDLWLSAAGVYTDGGKFSEMARAALDEFSTRLINEEKER